MYKRVEQDTSFVRDMRTNAIINIDNNSLQAYKKRRSSHLKLQNDVKYLKDEMSEIKTLLTKLLDK